MAYCKRRDKPCAEVLVKKLRYQCIVTEKPVHKVDFYERGWFDYCDSWMPEQTDDPKPAVKQETKEERIARMVADFKKGVVSERIQEKGYTVSPEQEDEVQVQTRVSSAGTIEDGRAENSEPMEQSGD